MNVLIVVWIIFEIGIVIALGVIFHKAIKDREKTMAFWRERRAHEKERDEWRSTRQPGELLADWRTRTGRS